MSERMGSYDSALQMFVEAQQEPDKNRLEFMKWLKEHGRLETPAAKEAESPEQQVTLPVAVEPIKQSQLKAAGKYDSSLQMFIQEPIEPDQSRLEFLRWLAENDRLEHGVAGSSSGELVVVFNAADHEPGVSVVA